MNSMEKQYFYLAFIDFYSRGDNKQWNTEISF